jgi:hypothetical protein
MTFSANGICSTNMSCHTGSPNTASLKEPNCASGQANQATREIDLRCLHVVRERLGPVLGGVVVTYET